MFWRFGGYANISTIDSILDKPDVTIEELLEDPDLVQELKQQNSKLIEFLRDENVLERLLQYVVAPKVSEGDVSFESEQGPRSSTGGALGWLGGKRRDRSKSIGKSEEDTGEESKEEKQRLKYAYVACEILSSEVWSIAEAVLENQQALRKFWDYLKTDEPLDAVQAGYFTKVNESLLDKKTEEMLELFKTLDNVVPDILRHIECPCVMDLLLKLISLERVDSNNVAIIDWLQAQGLIPLLLAHLTPEHSSATQTSAGDFLKAIITISANSTGQDTNVIGPNELTRQLVSAECVQTLIDCMLHGGNPLTVGVGVIIEVIRKNNSDYDAGNSLGPVPKSSDPIYLGTLLRQFANSVPLFMDLIQGKRKSAPTKTSLKVAFGGSIEPLGFHRFKTCELMAELLHCSNMALLNERGAAEEVRLRDVERKRLRAEQQTTAEQDAAAFSTSVDSQGFHHARAISISEDTPELVKKLDVVNSTEEEFENVNPAEVLVDDVKDDFDEKDASVPVTDEALPQTQVEDVGLRPSPLRTDSTARIVEMEAKQDAAALSAPSPTSAGITERLETVGLDQDALMADIEKQASGEADDAPTGLGIDASKREMSPHSDDKPAPLFSSRKAQLEPDQDPLAQASANDQAPPAQSGMSHEPPTESEDGEHTQAEQHEEFNDLPYTTDLDGKPVVGDHLKMQFVEHHVVPTILDFFFRFPWNNFLHNVVYDVVQQVFNGSMERGNNRSLAIDLFDTGRITDRIIEGQAASDKSQREQKMRLGYMGHLTLIAEEVVKFTERHPVELLSQTVLDKVMDQSWIDYVEQILAETRERDNAILGGVRPDLSVGPRQAVLNAVNAASGYGSNTGGNSFSNMSNSAPLNLDSSAITPAADSGSTLASQGGAQYLFSGSSLLSGFSHGSSDEEEDEMDVEGGGGAGDLPRVNPNPLINEEDQETPYDDSTPLSPDPGSDDDSTPSFTSSQQDGSSSGSIPAPLKFHPTRARRQFAKRMAERQLEQEAAAKEAADAADTEDDAEKEAESAKAEEMS